MTVGISDAVVPARARDSIREDQCGGFGVRALARIIDTVLAFLAAIAGSVVMGLLLAMLEISGKLGSGWQARLQHGQALGFVIALAGSFVAMALSEAIGGTSFGKLVLGYRVVSLDTLRPCSVTGAVIRSAAYFVDALFFGAVAWLSMNGSAHKQRLGDLWGDTAVVKASALPDTAKQPLLVVAAGIFLALVARGAIAAADIALRVWT